MTNQRLLPSPKSTITNRPGRLDPAVDAYMQMVAQTVYDLIRKYRERHAKDKSEQDQVGQK